MKSASFNFYRNPDETPHGEEIDWTVEYEMYSEKLHATPDAPTYYSREIVEVVDDGQEPVTNEKMKELYGYYEEQMIEEMMNHEPTP